MIVIEGKQRWNGNCVYSVLPGKQCILPIINAWCRQEGWGYCAKHNKTKERIKLCTKCTYIDLLILS